jgi:hypothetical protein
MARVTIIFYFLVFLNSLVLQGQNKPIQLEIHGLAVNTPASDIRYANTINSAGTSFTSEDSYGFGLQFRLSKSITKRIDLVAGLNLGVYSHNETILISEDFNDLVGSSPYSHIPTRITNYDIKWAALVVGARIPIVTLKQSKLLAEIGLNLNYNQLQTYSTAAKAPINNGTGDTEFETYYVGYIGGINENRFIVSPSIGLMYQRYFKNDKIGLSLGGYMNYSRRDYLQGTFTLFGDTENLEGILTKRFSMTGVTLGVVWKLNKDKE